MKASCGQRTCGDCRLDLKKITTETQRAQSMDCFNRAGDDALLKEAPENLKGKVAMYSGEIPALMSLLESEGYQHAYIDGGSTITSFLNLGLINEMTITRAPILLGEGITLFGKINKPIKLEDSQATAYPNDFIQIKYKVNYL